jgi:UDP-N-acetylglucosamine 2-epimerase
MVDAVASVLCAPSETAERALLREHAGGLVRRTGDIAHDVLLRSLPLVPETLAQWPASPAVLATLHRAELTDHREKLAAVLEGLGRLGVPVLFPAHPRTRDRIERHGLTARIPGNVLITEPLGYFEALAAIRLAVAVVTDSGGVQREAYWLGTPCLTIRDETEWPETVLAEANVLVPPAAAPDGLGEAFRRQTAGRSRNWRRDAYGTGEAATAIVSAIEAAGLAA